MRDTNTWKLDIWIEKEERKLETNCQRQMWKFRRVKNTGWRQSNVNEEWAKKLKRGRIIVTGGNE